MKRFAIIGIVLTALVAAVIFAWPQKDGDRALRVGMAPYQDLAMIVNAEPLGLEEKYGTQLDLVTMNWEDIPAAVASAGRGVDVGFGSYIEYLTKYEKLNAGSSDPVLFVAPLYAFKGGAFVTFDRNITRLTPAMIEARGDKTVAALLKKKIGAQRASVYEMMIDQLAVQHGTDPNNITIIDTPLDQGFLAAEQGSLDIATAGLTQLTEAERRGGRVVLTMDDMRFADLTGVLVKRSVYEKRRKEVEDFIRMWFESVDHVYSNIDKNSAESLAYLDKNASTRYTLDEYKKALSQEYLPRSIGEANNAFLQDGGQFPVKRIGNGVNQFLVRTRAIKSPTPIPSFLMPE